MLSPTADTTTDLARSLGLALLRFGRSLRHGSDVELSPSLVSALATVTDRGPLTPSELAALERVRRPTATRFIACLEHAGLVSRTADPDDGRSYRVAVTAPGLDLLVSARRQNDAHLAERLGRLDEDERRTLERAAGILERLVAAEPPITALAEEPPIRVLAEEPPIRVLAAEPPITALAEEPPITALAEEPPIRVLAGDER